MRRQKLVLKIKYLTNKVWKYWCEQERNIFRTKQLAKFGLLLTTGMVFFVFINNILPHEQWKWYWKLMGTYFVPPFGKESVIPLGISQGIPPFIWSTSIIIFDFLACVTILTNWWLLEAGIKHFKLISKWYNAIHKRMQRIESKKYGVLVPLVLLGFMCIPLQGSGAITTALIGTLLGFKQRDIIIVVIIGSTLSTVLITLSVLKFVM